MRKKMNKMNKKIDSQNDFAIMAAVLIIAVVIAPTLTAIETEIPANASVPNIAPSFISLSIPDDSADPGYQVINPDPGRNKTVRLEVVLCDMNGHDDISNVNANITGPSHVDPFTLKLNRTLNVSTAVYEGYFNMSYHKQGEYTITVRACDKGGMSSQAELNFTYSYGEVEVVRYDFSDGAGEDKWAYRYQCAELPPNTSDVPSIEFTPRQYSFIKSRNYIMYVSVTDKTGYHAAHRFVFNIRQPENILMMNISWWGFGFKFLGEDGATLFIWNCTAGRYERIDRDNSIFAMLKGSISDGISNYIDECGNITILVEQNSPQTTATSFWRSIQLHSFLGTDYICLDVHYLSPC